MRIRKETSSSVRLAVAVASILISVIVYDVLSHLSQSAALPSLSEIAKAGITVCTPQSRGEIWLLDDFYASYGRLAIAMMFSCVIGVSVGTLMGCYDVLDSFLYPILGFACYSPSTAIVPVLTVFFNTSEWLFLVLLSISIAPALACKISTAIRSDIPIEMIDKTYTLGASHDEVIWNYVLRQMVPRIIDNIRLQLGPAFVAVIAAELLVGSVGFGYRLRFKSRQLQWDIVYVYLIFLSASGFVLEYSLVRLRKKLCPWFNPRR